MRHSEAQEDALPSIADPEDVIFARLKRRIRGAQANPSTKYLERPYVTTATQDFWERHLKDLVNDSLGLGFSRFQGLADFRDLLHHVFETASPLLMGYLQLAGHVNNQALTDWMPESRRTAPKIQALAQLHARSLILFEEVFALVFMGYPSGASALSRTLHEVRVTSQFLYRFEARLSERYLASHIVSLWQQKADYRPRGAAQRSREWKETERELDERYDSVLAKFGPSMTIENGWAWPRFSKSWSRDKPPRRIPFSWIEEAVGLPSDRARYRSSSQQVHATHLGNIKTVRGFKPGEILLGPRPSGLANPAVQAIWDVQSIAESLLRACGRFRGEEDDIYYWLEALDQLSYVLRGLVTDAQASLDYVFSEDSDDRNVSSGR